MFGAPVFSEYVPFGLSWDGDVSVATTTAPHGTGPRRQERTLANPLAMLLADAGVLDYVGTDGVR